VRGQAEADSEGGCEEDGEAGEQAQPAVPLAARHGLLRALRRLPRRPRWLLPLTLRWRGLPVRLLAVLGLLPLLLLPGLLAGHPLRWRSQALPMRVRVVLLRLPRRCLRRVLLPVLRRPWLAVRLLAVRWLMRLCLPGILLPSHPPRLKGCALPVRERVVFVQVRLVPPGVATMAPLWVLRLLTVILRVCHVVFPAPKVPEARIAPQDG